MNYRTALRGWAAMELQHSVDDVFDVELRYHPERPESDFRATWAFVVAVVTLMDDTTCYLMMSEEYFLGSVCCSFMRGF